MALVRVVSNDEWNEAVLTSAEWTRLRLLFWKDPACQEILKAATRSRRICPVIELWRKTFGDR